MRNEKAVYLIQIWLHRHWFESNLKFLNSSIKNKHMFFEVKVEFRTVDPNKEKPKKETVKYLVDAESVTESEARVYAHFESLFIKDFEVKSSVISKLVDVIYPLAK